MRNNDIIQLLASVVLIDRRSSGNNKHHDLESIPLTRTIHGAQVAAGGVTPLVGFYFGANWCPPCRSFSPILSDFAQKNAESFSVVFVSVDHSGKECEDFQKGKSFLSIPFDSPVRQVLLEKMTVRSFPTLIVCNIKTGKVLTRWGRLAVMNERRSGELVTAWIHGRSGVTLVKPIHMILLVAFGEVLDGHGCFRAQPLRLIHLKVA